MSQAVIGNLRVNLGLDTAAFSAGTKQAQGALAGLSNSLKGFAAGMAGLLTLGGVTSALQNSISRMDELGKSAQKIGIPVEALSKLEYAARLADLPLSDLETTMGRFARSLAEIQTGGTNGAGSALENLGVKATTAQGQLRPTVDILLDLADKFRTMPDGAQKSALAMELFGKSGADMVPFLNQGSDAIRRAMDEARAFGLEVSQNAAKSAEDFNDNLTRLKSAGEGLSQQLTKQLVPSLAEVTEGLVTYVREGDKIESAIAGIKAEFGDLARIVTLTADGMERLAAWSAKLDELAKNFGPFSRNAQNGFFGAFPGKTDLPPGVLPSPKGDLPPGVMDRLQDNRFKASPSDLDSMLKSLDDPASGGGLKRKTETANPLAIPKIPPGTIEDVYGYGEAVRSVKLAFDQADPAARQFQDALSGISSSIETGLSEALSGLISGTTSAKEAFAEMARSIANTLADLSAQLISSGLMKLLTGALGGGMGAGLNIGGLTFGGLYANGGTLGAGQWGIAGEAGPEIIHGPARITPMDRALAPSQTVVNVHNHSSSKVSTRPGLDGSLDVIIEEVIADKLLRGGNKVDSAMARGYGLRRQGR